MFFEALVRAYKLQFFSVGTFGGLALPPPPIPKIWLRYCIYNYPNLQFISVCFYITLFKIHIHMLN